VFFKNLQPISVGVWAEMPVRGAKARALRGACLILRESDAHTREIKESLARAEESLIDSVEHDFYLGQHRLHR
jgi:hypothetical protein